jgi:TetR/AcrR family transcriptional regulator, transcriptional repressor of aconitase
MPKLSEQEKDVRRERILVGARRCFARYGYEGATVVRLEKEIGLSRGAIFNWFPSKEALFLELATRDNARLLELLAEQGFEPLVHELVEEEPDWLAVYLEFGRRLRADAALRERWKDIAPEEARIGARRWIEEGQRSGELRGDVGSEEIGRFLGVVLDGIVVQRGLGFDAPDADLVVRLVRDAIAGPSAASP